MVAFHMTCCIIELAIEYRDKGDPKLQYKDVCKRDMKALNWTPPAGNRWQTTERLGNKNCHPSTKRGNSLCKQTPKGSAGEGQNPCHQTHLQLMTLFYLPRLQPPQSCIGMCSHTVRCSSVHPTRGSSIVWRMPITWPVNCIRTIQSVHTINLQERC